MFKTGLLLLTGSIRCVVESIGNYLTNASKNVGKRLYIKIETDCDNPMTKSDTSGLSILSKSIPLIYFKAASLCSNLDVRILLPERRTQNTSEQHIFDVIMTDSFVDMTKIMCYIEKQFGNQCRNIIEIKNSNSGSNETESSNTSEFNVYQNVILGGTFDRLHNGHKVLLSEAVMRTTGKLFVGITDGKLLERKVLSELIQPIHKRIECVREFLLDVDPSIHYEVQPILDPFGPTITDPEYDCIVVSEETKPGGIKINTERKKKGWKELAMYTVDLVENISEDVEDDSKLSSTSVRKRLLGTLQKPGTFPDEGKPFRIHLIGAPTSGKSCISRILQTFGAEVISCDKEINCFLNKEMTPAQKIKLFSDKEYIQLDNSLDYKELTKEILRDAKKREWFNLEIGSKIQKIIEEKFQESVNKGARVVLIQSSVLLDLNWKSNAHQLWTTVLPLRDNMQRLQECYQFTEDESINVLSSVPSNKENVQFANVIFSNQWTPEFTKKQVEKAWSCLSSTLTDGS